MGPTGPVDLHVPEVLIMSRELSKESEMTSYFAKKFAPAPPLVVLGSSYKSSPECKPEQTLYDNWLDQSHPHLMGPALYSHRKLLIVGLSQWLVNHQISRNTTWPAWTQQSAERLEKSGRSPS